MNVPEDKARRAAEAMTPDTELVRLSARVDAVKVDLEGRFDRLKADLEGRFERLQTHVDGRFALLQWMIAFNLAMTVALLWKVFAAH